MLDTFNKHFNGILGLSVFIKEQRIIHTIT